MRNEYLFIQSSRACKVMNGQVRWSFVTQVKILTLSIFYDKQPFNSLKDDCDISTSMDIYTVCHSACSNKNNAF